MPREPALAGHRSANGGWVAKAGCRDRSRHRVNEGQDVRSERSVIGRGQPRPAKRARFKCEPYEAAALSITIRDCCSSNGPGRRRIFERTPPQPVREDVRRPRAHDTWQPDALPAGCEYIAGGSQGCDPGNVAPPRIAQVFILGKRPEDRGHGLPTRIVR